MFSVCQRLGEGVPHGTFPPGQATYSLPRSGWGYPKLPTPSPPQPSQDGGGGTQRYQGIYPFPNPSQVRMGIGGYPKVPTPPPPAKVPTPPPPPSVRIEQHME